MLNIQPKHFTRIGIFSVLVIIGILSYEENANGKIPLQKNTKAPILAPLKNLDRKEVPKALLTLSALPKTTIKQGDIRGNLFGKFFYDRAEFYVIENPQNKIYSSTTESITLFYLDGELSKTKYILSSNIAPFLLKDLGNCSIKGLNVKNSEIITDGKPIFKKGGKVMLNKELDNYELTWTFKNKEIVYRVNNENTKFEYIERNKNYEQQFKAIERNTY